MKKPNPIEPHPVLSRYYTDQKQRPTFVRGLFDRTARHYDRLNQLFSFGTGNWYRSHALLRAGLKPGMQILDVATGTGLLARQAAQVGGSKDAVFGLDVSGGMLNEARRALGIHLIQASAEQLPVADDSFDFVTMGYALRHVSDLEGAFYEFHRVLKPRGVLLMLEIGKPPTRLRHSLLSAYLGYIVPLLSRWTTGAREAQTLMRYHWDTIEQCVPLETILKALSRAGFIETRCDIDFDMFRAYFGRKA